MKINVSSWNVKVETSFQDHKVKAKVEERRTSYVNGFNKENYKFLYYHKIQQNVVPRIARWSNNLGSLGHNSL